MKRITTDNVNEMGMVGLAHNCCYIGKDGAAIYRDFDIDIDARKLTIKLLEKYADIPNEFTCDEDFDDFMLYSLQHGTDDILGLIAVFYRNLWAMAELRENLKRYEDLEEQGRLVLLPCKVGDTLYHIFCGEIIDTKVRTFFIGHPSYNVEKRNLRMIRTDRWDIPMDSIGKTVFLTRKEAEAALEKMGGGEE